MPVHRGVIRGERVRVIRAAHFLEDRQHFSEKDNTAEKLTDEEFRLQHINVL